MEIEQETDQFKEKCTLFDSLVGSLTQVDDRNEEDISADSFGSHTIIIDEEIQQVASNALVKKCIAKLHKTQSKKFKKKQLMIIPNCIMTRQLSQDMLLILFGGFDVETEYKDYKDQYDNHLIIYVERMFSKVQVIKNSKLGMVEVQTNPITNSGLKDFTFLINKFINMQNKSYAETACQLQIHQNNIQTSILQQIQKQKNRIQKSQRRKEEYLETQAEFVEQFKNYIEKEYSPSSFYNYKLQRTNFQTGEIEVFQYGFSYSLASLLGIEQDQLEHLVLRGPKYYKEPSGNFRLEFFNFLIKLYNSGIQKSEPYPFILKSYDGITINCSVIVESINFPIQSKWINIGDFTAQIMRYNVSENQVKAVIDIRSQQNNFDIEIFHSPLSNNVEYTMYQEIFLEKFYPQFYVQNSINSDGGNNQAQVNQPKQNVTKKGILLKKI